MRTLGIDYGKARIGLALADQSLTIATPIGYIINKGERKNLAAMTDLIKKHNVSRVVLGMPLHTDGSPGTLAAEVQQFGAMLERELCVTVFYQDERYTSKIAEDEILEKMRITDPKKIKELVDTIAASMILKDSLEKLKGDINK